MPRVFTACSSSVDSGFASGANYWPRDESDDVLSASIFLLFNVFPVPTRFRCFIGCTYFLSELRARSVYLVPDALLS